MKKFFVAAVAAAVLLGLPAASMAVGVRVNGEPVSFSEDSGIPFVENGRTLVPLRSTAEAYGASVDYDGNSRTAIVEKDGVTVTVPIGESCIYRNGLWVVNDAPARIINSRTYLPIRIVMEAVGATVEWDGEAQEVIITDPDRAFIKGVEEGPAQSFRWPGQEWDYWNAALAKMEEGNWEEARDQLVALAPTFAQGEANNIGLLFNNLAKCYAALGDYHRSSLCYRRASEYMYQVPGQSEQALRFAIMADEADAEVKVYFKTDDSDYSAADYFGAPGEPRDGVVFGSTYYSNTEDLTGFPCLCRLQYLDYGEEMEKHRDTYFDPDGGNIIQIAWQPRNGLGMVRDDDYLFRQAEFLEDCGCQVLLRFAGEMNLPSSEWYAPNPEEYIEKFRLVADIFHEVAPSVGIVWAPNFYPIDTVDEYYPGDEYVDYVGVSLYSGYSLENDPLDQGVDRSRLVNLLDHIYETYGSRKPIMVAEGGMPFDSGDAGREALVYRQYLDYFAYMPMKYPNLKFMTLFDINGSNGDYNLSASPAALTAVREGLRSDGRYVDDLDEDDTGEYYCEFFNNITLPAEVVELRAFVYSPLNISRVVYSMRGMSFETAEVPYGVTLDLSDLGGTATEISAAAYDDSGRLVADKTFTVHVE